MSCAMRQHGFSMVKKVMAQVGNHGLKERIKHFQSCQIYQCATITILNINTHTNVTCAIASTNLFQLGNKTCNFHMMLMISTFLDHTHTRNPGKSKIYVAVTAMEVSAFS